MAADRKPDLDALEARLVGPRRVGLFGHRAVGKTTLLAMLYREASSGRLPGVRLAALDARGAEYLADKIAQIEAGESPAGTLAETELRLRLYRGASRVDLVLKDYQGEHVGLGSEAPIQQFLADCDAVLFCLDPEGSPGPADRRRRQQEVEQLLERYLDASESLATNRPIAVLVTKYDRVLARGGPLPEEVDQLVQAYYGMTQHALHSHAPRSTLFAVSSFGTDGGADGLPPDDLQPLGFDQVLNWLAEQLEQSDREQLDWIWDVAPDDYSRLSRCLKAFARRYPQSKRVIEYRRRLGRLGRRRVARGLARGAAGVALIAAGLASYDAVGYHLALRHQRHATSARSIAERWDRYLAWHPTQPLFWPADSRAARGLREEWRVKSALQRAEVGAGSPEEIRAELDRMREEAPRQAPAISQVERALQDREHEAAWAEIQAQALLDTRPADQRLEMLQTFVHEHRDSPHLDEALRLAQLVRHEIEERAARDDRGVVDRLRLDSRLPDPDYPDLIDRGRRFLDDRPDSRLRPEVEQLVATLVEKLDARDFDAARALELAAPDRNFDLQIRKYQDYLRDHRDGGAFVEQAKQALDRIARRRDLQGYRAAYDHARAHPEDVPEVARRLRDYLARNPQGRYAGAARGYLDWWQKIESTGEYRVTLERARVDPAFTKSLAGQGPDLQVVVWVGTEKYGPSPVVPDRVDPVWNYTFPRPIRWRYGEPVLIQVIDTDWSDSVVATLRSARGDKLALRNLSGEVRPTRDRDKVVVEFASDFSIPRLPAPAE